MRGNDRLTETFGDELRPTRTLCILVRVEMTMSGWQAMVWAGCGLAAISAVPGVAQNVPTALRPPAMKTKPISFRDAKPVMGLPSMGANPHIDASGDGTVFVTISDDTQPTKGGELYSVTLSGTVKRLIRPMGPQGYDAITKVDSFATEHEYGELLAGETHENGDKDKRVTETRYFLSLTELDGSDGKLLPLDVKFKPLKLAMFGDGGFLMLGLDEVNLLPVLVLLKDDGTVRRFLDLDNRASDGGLDALSMKGAMKPETVELLERARFSPFGNNVLLAQPGTAAPVHDLNAFGEDRKIPVSYPAGWVMHDVLAGSQQWTMVVRMQPSGRIKDAAANYQRLFEVDVTHGSLLNEFTFDMPSVTDVTCAPPRKIAAMYLQPLPDASLPSDGNSEQKEQPPKLELVVGTAPR